RYRFSWHVCIVRFPRTCLFSGFLLFLHGGQPVHIRMPFAQDLKPGPHQSLAGLAWQAAHAAATSSAVDSSSERTQPQWSRSSLTLRTPSFFFARSRVVIEIPSSRAAVWSSVT